MKINSSNINDNFLIILKDNYWLENQRIAGKIVSNTLKLLKSLSKNESSLIELNKIAEEYIYDNNGSPTFKGYKGFPNGVCISVNNQLVHGIPTSYKLNDGDIVSFDLGVTYNGSIADAAITVIVGTPKSKTHDDLVKTCNDCLANAINSIKIGKKLGAIGNAIYKTATNKGYSVIDKYGGHFIGPGPHESPFISNKSNINEGVRFEKGMTFAIEPLITLSNSNETYLDNDGWTIYTKDLSAHFEHTLFLHEDSVEIITEIS